MSKKRIFALLIVALMLGAVFTNPKREQHELAVKEKTESLLKKQVGQKEQIFVNLGMKLFGKNIVDNFVSKALIVDNYYLFSLTKIKWQGKETIIGGGAFGKIWLSPKIDEKADEIVAAMKKMS
ncbi:DUF4359 domain-containing protein [Sphingobacterium sp. SRCM116780]|uniref:DUF4359 domain-containing protein n=1 Tax=Sphingobacterium sp. SRCM116780 TaxID=2907623 RepID=UPI001F491653|nr:DUF4359 domain-containing protein [Sphingobacterium sp. SRCM116780]UIR55707.1 DUF4359 domain-containing protein [Sphingobacterium sp. SRCM116780]